MSAKSTEKDGDFAGCDVLASFPHLVKEAVTRGKSTHTVKGGESGPGVSKSSVERVMPAACSFSRKHQ